MGMKIDIDESIKELSKWRKDLNYDNGDYCYGDDTTKRSLDVAIDTMRKYQQLQTDYENRLKADMVAMLTEIQLEMEENTVRWYVGRVDGKSDDVVLMETINDIIQQKINTLKENEDGTDEQKEATNEMP